MNDVERWYHETRARRAVEALKKHGFEAVYVQDAAEAKAFVVSKLSAGQRVGFGGSMTVKALGIQDAVQAAGGEVLDHGVPGLDQERKLEIMRAQLTCDLFISGSNALTLEGQIVNVDGNGNRVAALTFGPKATLVVMGANKIVRDLDEAFTRIETVASPLNNKRLSRPNPCTKSGECEDCQGPTRVCRVYQILERKPSLSDFTVVVVGEPLGY
jgi:L-lactate utilization protein LutB